MRDVDPVKVTPVEVRAPVGATVFEITFADGFVSRIDNELLRGYCPCAGCQGHSGEIRFVPGGNSVIGHIEEVGSYALQLTWGDGHASGIYTFRYFRALGEYAAWSRENPDAPRQVMPRAMT
ncbi:MAG: DUF971 domain-containing protein [Myxococcales bacterium]|nr:DUF971 domain-containing protein [Myxococcales bacterium]